MDHHYALASFFRYEKHHVHRSRRADPFTGFVITSSDDNDSYGNLAWTDPRSLEVCECQSLPGNRFLPAMDICLICLVVDVLAVECENLRLYVYPKMSKPKSVKTTDTHYQLPQYSSI